LTAQLKSPQPDNIELSTLVRVASALGAQVDVSIRPGRRAERQSRQLARPKVTR
jgi:hypothetical protein